MVWDLVKRILGLGENGGENASIEANRGRYANFEVWLSNHIKPTDNEEELISQLRNIANKLKRSSPNVAKAINKYIQSGAYKDSPFLRKP